MPEKLLTFTADKQAPALGCQPQIRTSVLDISTKFLQSHLKYFQKTTHLELILRTWQTLQAGRSCRNKSNNHFFSYCLFGVCVLASVCVSVNEQLKQCIHKQHEI